jgi:hypothetical protein
MIHDMAMLGGGFGISNPIEHNRRLSKVLQDKFQLESLKLEPEINPPVEEDDVEDEISDSKFDDEDEGDIQLDQADLGNLDIASLKEKFPDAGWPDKDKKRKNKKMNDDEL